MTPLVSALLAVTWLAFVSLVFWGRGLFYASHLPVRVSRE